jgi:hypothetical protein
MKDRRTVEEWNAVYGLNSVVGDPRGCDEDSVRSKEGATWPGLKLTCGPTEWEGPLYNVLFIL